MTPTTRPIRILSSIAAPLCPIALDYPHSESGADAIRHHRVAPGLAHAVKAYIQDTYHAIPQLVREDRTLHIDPGGCSAMNGEVVWADAGGFYVQTFLDVLEGAVWLLENAAEKLYGGVRCVRLQSFPDCMVVMLPEHRDAALRQLKPLVGEARGERIAMLQCLARSPHLYVPGFPLQEGEA